jgi:hypothetical protein
MLLGCPPVKSNVTVSSEQEHLALGCRPEHFFPGMPATL